jgi:hypothetical protein
VGGCLANVLDYCSEKQGYARRPQTRKGNFLGSYPPSFQYSKELTSEIARNVGAHLAALIRSRLRNKTINANLERTRMVTNQYRNLLAFQDLTDEMAGNVGDCLAALIQTMLRDGDTQRDSAAMGALGRLSKLGMTLRDGSAVSLRVNWGGSFLR